jgi:peptidoglycan/LPS O-acetylase OafA/YrhL
MEPQQRVKASSYMPQLDGLRALAIAGVFVTHFAPSEDLPQIAAHLPWGALGVMLFFVLSGFLITGILLDARSESSGSRSSWVVLRQFYIRRFLRILPLYYVVVFAAIITDIPYARAVSLWLITYTANLYISFQNDWIGNLSHLWTLAVEEQFYLVWPLLVLFLPRLRLWPVLTMMACAAPAYRLAALSFGIKGLAIEVFTVSCLDSLAAGSLLALAVRSNIAAHALGRWLFRAALPLGLLSGGALLYARSVPAGDLAFKVLFPDAAILIFTPLVFAASTGSRWMRFLEWAPLRYLGKISYGLYVLHLFVPLMFQPLFERMGVSYFEWEGRLWPHKSLLYFVLCTAFTTALAAFSWHCFEHPINRLKRFVPYQP